MQIPNLVRHHEHGREHGIHGQADGKGCCQLVSPKRPGQRAGRPVQPQCGQQLRCTGRKNGECHGNAYAKRPPYHRAGNKTETFGQVAAPQHALGQTLTEGSQHGELAEPGGEGVCRRGRHVGVQHGIGKQQSQQQGGGSQGTPDIGGILQKGGTHILLPRSVLRDAGLRAFCI